MNTTQRETAFLFAAGIAAIIAVFGADGGLGHLFMAILQHLKG